MLSRPSRRRRQVARGLVFTGMCATAWAVAVRPAVVFLAALAALIVGAIVTDVLAWRRRP